MKEVSCDWSAYFCMSLYTSSYGAITAIACLKLGIYKQNGWTPRHERSYVVWRPSCKALVISWDLLATASESQDLRLLFPPALNVQDPLQLHLLHECLRTSGYQLPPVLLLDHYGLTWVCSLLVLLVGESPEVVQSFRPKLFPAATQSHRLQLCMATFTFNMQAPMLSIFNIHWY